MKDPLINWNRAPDSDEPLRQYFPVWVARSAVALTVTTCLFYGALFFLIPEYKQIVAERMMQLPMLIRIALNIYQSYLLVLILISIALMIIFFLKSRSTVSSYRPILFLVSFNFVFAVVLFAVAVVGIV